VAVSIDHRDRLRRFASGLRPHGEAVSGARIGGEKVAYVERATDRGEG
jgi:hypothetical protein